MYIKGITLSLGVLAASLSSAHAQDLNYLNEFSNGSEASTPEESPAPSSIDSEPSNFDYNSPESIVPSREASVTAPTPQPENVAYEQAASTQCCKKPAKKPIKPWKVLFFNNDFSYKNACCAPSFLGEELKDMQLDFLPCESRVSAGGELRFRHINEDNRLRPGGPGKSTYDQWRWRNYVDFKYSKRVRAYVEMIDASQVGEEMAPLGIDVNRWDILNAFVDIGVTDSITARLGRQELLLGSQRLVSPLDWSNTRRNFEGFRLMRKGDNWDVDLWATHPVNTAAGNGPLAVFDNGRDKADGSRYFSGAWATYKGFDMSKLDLYWMWDREADAAANANLGRAAGADISRHTLGGRYQYDRPVKDGCCEVARIWHADIEGGYQFGHDNDETVKAAFFTGGLGHTWKKLPWAPTLWMYYDWASGDEDPNDNENNTFNHTFPLGHAYMGLIDNVARQNISDVNFKLVTHPTKKLTFITAFHWMDLDTQNDFIYNVAQAPLGTTGNGQEIGEELDFVVNYQFNPNLGVQAGYFWFWYGDAVTNSALNRDDAEQFYLQTTLRY